MGRPRKHPVIPSDSASALMVGEKGKGDSVEGASTKGRKKRVATDKSLDVISRKRVKIEATANEISKEEQVVVKLPAKSTRTKSSITAPKWKLVRVVNPVRDSKSLTGQTPPSIKTLSPRIWTGSREELLALLPELAGAKCFNGISWYRYPTPMVVLDDSNLCFEIERQAAQPLCVDLITTRSFVSPIPATPAHSLQDPAPSAQQSQLDATPQQASKAKPLVIRKAPRYGVPKFSKKNGVIAKKEPVPSTTLSPMEPPVAHMNTFAVTPAPPAVVQEVFSMSTSSGSHPTAHATTPPPPSPINLPAFSNEAFIGENKPCLLPKTWEQINILDAMIDEACLTRGKYPAMRESATSTASGDGPSYSSHSMSYRLSVQSSWSIPLASSSKLTLDVMDPLRGSSHYLPGNSISAPAQRSPVVDEILAISTQKNPIALDSDASASLDSSSSRESRKTTVPAPLSTSPTTGTPYNATQAANEVILADIPQTAGSPPAPVPFPMPEIRSGTDLASPETRSIDTIPKAEVEQPSVSVMIDEMVTEMNLATVGDIPPIPQTENGAAASSQIQDAMNLDDFIPKQLPDEITALVEAYVFGRPLSIMISRDRLKDNWGIEVKKEYAYAALGFFRILGLQEVRFQDDNVKVSKLANGLCAGQVQWRFHLEWACGGEEIILPNHPSDSFDRPWWNEKVADPSPTAASEAIVPSETELPSTPPKDNIQPDEPETRYPTTARHREARMANHEYKFRHCPLSDAYDSILPEQVLVPFGRQHSDRVFPRGWLCTKCGRLNFQQALRHRKCPSSRCKDEPAPAEPYFYDLYSIRDPQERLPLNYPRNTYPPGTKVSQKKWEDGTQTFTYNINGNSNIYIKHVFLSNVEKLQKPVSNLMERVQLTVPLLRPMVENNPYYFFKAKSPKGKAASTKQSWEGVPGCINDAKKQVLERASSSAEIPEKLISIKHLKVVAWITEGSRRGNEVISAKNKCAILLAMGCTTMLTVTPRFLEKTNVANTSSGRVDASENSREDIESGWVAMNGRIDDEPSVEDLGSASASTRPKKGRGPKKKDRPSFTFSLYHGDMVVLYGDDFEYSFKRDGTSFMLFASHDEIV